MKKHVKTLDSISGKFFIAGFFTARLKLIPIVMLSSILNIVSLSAYLIGYMVWYTTAFFYPDHQRNREAWYGFAEFKEQTQAAALLGTVATAFCLITPALIIPAAWIYNISNILWSIGEYHKKAKPPTQDPLFSSVKQALYFRYSLLATCTSVLTSLAATIIFFFPIATLAVTITAGIIGVGLMAVAGYYWGKCFFGVFPPDREVIPQTYVAIAEQLEVNPNAQENTVTEALHAQPLFRPAVAEDEPLVNPQNDLRL